MASVLSGWYGYNLFNIANFIEYEPYPKRRKLDHKSAASAYSHHRGISVAGYVHHHHGQDPHGDYELTHKEASSRVNSSGLYRPYTEAGKSKSAKYQHHHHQDVGQHHHHHAGSDRLLEDLHHQEVESGQVEEVENEGKMTFDHLFPEILGLIFEKLDIQSLGRAAQVCSRWRDAVYLKSNWKGVVAKLHLRRSNPTLYPSLVRRGINSVQVLSLRKSLRDPLSGMPNLEALNLSGCYNLSDSALDTALNRDLPNLKVLNLSLCKEVTDNSLGRIATHCKNLEELDLGGCSKITNTGLLLISWGLKKIRRLNLRSCWQISDHGIGHLTGAAQGSESPSPAARSGGARRLEELCLQDCQKVTDESLKHISEGLPAVSRLNLSFCLSVTDTGLKSLSHMSSLRDLNLRSCDNVSDIGIGFLGSGGGGNGGGSSSSGTVTAGSPLTRLDVSFCDRVTDSSMAHVGNGLVNLTSLSLSACGITDLGVTRISKDLAKGLLVLNIGQCSKVTDEGLAAISKNMKSLTSVDLYGCTNVTPKGLKSLEKMKSLKTINRGLWHQF